MTVQHKSKGRHGMFYVEEDGEVAAEMVYNSTSENKMIIEHTEVNPSLEGRGVGKQLLAALIEYVRANDIKVVPLCPFANAMLKRTKEWQDVLA